MTRNTPRRFEGQHPHKRFYDSKVWKDLRAVHLSKHPLCAWCLLQGTIRTGNTVHHKQPHRGDWTRFNDPTNLETLCAPCHSGAAQQAEAIGYASTVGDDGWPVDINHPQNKARGS